MNDRDSKRTTKRSRARKTPGTTPPGVLTASRRESEVATTPDTKVRGPGRGTLSIIGIGASAGGLEALEQFFGRVPEHSGMAFVIIQHLDPTHKAMVAELLQRSTAMPVVQVSDRLMVEADHVYVIPPNRDMSILHGVLHLFPRPSGLNLPIDFFFRSLAEDQHERSVGVLLSGMGSDGTLGLRAIKEKAGAGFVQEPTSAKFDSMPRSAIEAGLADVVAPAEELPGRIVAYCQHAPHIALPDMQLEDTAESEMRKVVELLRTQSGHDFSLYKQNTICRRVERRMSIHQIQDLAGYVRFLRENRVETELLFKELLIGVTSFFRDPAAWEQLGNEAIPALLSAQSKDRALRAWVPGCSTGEEAYSLAIVFKEALERIKPVKKYTLQIFATDLDREVVEKARAGVYSANIAADVSAERLRRFFVQHEHGYNLGKDIREMVVFAQQNIIKDPPFTKLDILSCRNLLIYLSPELQKKLIPLFQYCLNPSGILILGSAETTGAFPDLFSSLDGKARLYRRSDVSASATPVDFPSSFTPLARVGVGESKEEPDGTFKAPLRNLETLADRVIIQRISPPVVFTDEKGDIVYISGRTGKYLEPAVGKTSVNVFAMAREGLRRALSGPFSAALRGKRPATVRGVQVRANGGTQTVDLTVQKLTEPRELKGTMMIVIAEVPKASAPAAPTARGKAGRIPPSVTRLEELEEDLGRAHEELRTFRDNVQTWQEEFQSTNEELQSSNEELTTSKEEMQSMNEELQTVNNELRAKVDELSQASNDMTNLLNSTEIATLFLDSKFRVRRFTPHAARIIKLIPSDAGRPFTDIVTALDYPELADDAKEVLRTLVFKEKTVSARDNRWFSVRIMPYRTQENVIDGLVITFTDASVSKSLEAALRKEEIELRKLADSLPQLVWSSRADGDFDYLSRQWIDYTGIPEAEQLGERWLHQVSPDDRKRVRTEWNAAVTSGATLDSEFRIRSADGAYRWFKARAAPTRDAKGLVVKWYGTCTDINDIRPAEKKARAVVKKKHEPHRKA